jgi:hypothetical protein
VSAWSPSVVVEQLQTRHRELTESGGYDSDDARRLRAVFARDTDAVHESEASCRDWCRKWAPEVMA